MQENIKILKEIDEEIINSMIRIGNDNFAHGYITKEYILSYLGTEKSFILIYQENKETFGFSICSLWNSDELFTQTKGFHSIVREHGMHENDTLELGVIKTIAIDLDYQKKGIGTAFFKASEARLKTLKVKSLVVPAWVYNGLTPMKKILDSFDYEPWFCLEKFWISSCDTKEDFCPQKKGNSCQCNSYFYKKENLY